MHAAHIQVKNGDKDGEFEWELFSRIETCFDTYYVILQTNITLRAQIVD